MESRILQKRYKTELEKDIRDAVSLGVDYRNIKGRYLSRDQLHELWRAIRVVDDGEKWEEWLFENFPEIIDEQMKIEMESWKEKKGEEN